MAPRELDPGWEHCTQLEEGNKRKLQCNYCHKIIYGGIARLKQHLAGISGDVAACAEVPGEVKRSMNTYVRGKQKETSAGKKKKRMMDEDLAEPPAPFHLSSDDAEDREMQAARKASRHSFQTDEALRRMEAMGYRRSSSMHEGGSQRERADRDLPVHRSSSMRETQPTLDPYLQKQSATQVGIKAAVGGIKKMKDKLGKFTARFLIYNNLAFSVVDSVHFKNMIQVAQEAGNAIRPPSAKDVATYLLDAEYEENQAYVEGFRKYWEEFGCTLMCDGWTTSTRRSLINFLVYCPAGTCFLKSVDATSKVKNAVYICELLSEVVDFIGEEHVVQVVTDNGANYKLAGKLLMEKRPQLYWSPCAAHSLDLMLEDIGKDKEIKELIKKCQKITVFIYNHSGILSLLRAETGGREILRPAVTRFATHFLTMESLLQHKEALRRVFLSEAWSDVESRMKDTDRQIGHKVSKYVRGNSFWNSIAHVSGIYEPLVKVLRLVDSDDKAEMGFLYEAMEKAKAEIAKNVGQKEARKWWAVVDARWDKTLHHDLHAAGYFLNPRMQYAQNARNDHEVMGGLKAVIQRMALSTKEAILANQEALTYRRRLGEFGTRVAMEAIKIITPGDWWLTYGREDAPNLCRIAVRVLSQTVSASQCERNWVTFSLIHTKTRTRLGMDKLMKLVFCHYNMRLRQMSAKRNDNPDQYLIDLDIMFHDEDPLVDWIREQEPALLDDDPNFQEALQRELQREADEEVERLAPRVSTRSRGGTSGSTQPTAHSQPTKTYQRHTQPLGSTATDPTQGSTQGSSTSSTSKSHSSAGDGDGAGERVDPDASTYAPEDTEDFLYRHGRSLYENTEEMRDAGGGGRTDGGAVEQMDFASQLFGVPVYVAPIWPVQSEDQGESSQSQTYDPYAYGADSGYSGYSGMDWEYQ